MIFYEKKIMKQVEIGVWAGGGCPYPLKGGDVFNEISLYCVVRKPALLHPPR